MDKKIDLTKLTSLFQKENRIKLLVLTGLVGIMLIFLSSLGLGDDKAEIKSESFNEASYTDELQKKVCSMVESIEGVGRAKVTISLETSESFEFAKERKTQSDTSKDLRLEEEQRVSQRLENENKYIIIEDEHGTKKPVIETAYTPSVRGAVIVCEGGGSSSVKTRVTKAVTTILGIGWDKVFVVKG